MAEDAESMSVRAGVEFEISLPSTPSTGYDWQVASCPGEIQQAEGRYSPAANEPAIVGSAGMHIFRFRATVKGSFTIQFVLKRSWEKRSTRSRTFKVSVGG
jgi:predicted secreted protein